VARSDRRGGHKPGGAARRPDQERALCRAQSVQPGNFSKPHFHPNNRFITVVKGTWWVATGNKVDKDNMEPMPAGSFVTHFGKQVHWDGAKNEEAWVLIVGEGPGTLNLVEEAK
jgi:gentisate 1,2-dioxygenase